MGVLELVHDNWRASETLSGDVQSRIVVIYVYLVHATYFFARVSNFTRS